MTDPINTTNILSMCVCFDQRSYGFISQHVCVCGYSYSVVLVELYKDD